MHVKLFVILFFDKIKFIILFLFLVSASSLLIVKQFDGIVAEPEHIEIPDIEIMGSQESEDSNSDIIYRGLNDLVMQLDEKADYDAKVYGMIVKNVYTFSSPFYQVSFDIYEAEKGFFDRFKNQVASGTIPHQGKKEVLVGYNAALHYQLEVGDVINKETGLNVDGRYEEYIVSGILGEKDRYYENGFFILKKDVQSADLISEDNMVMIYASGKQAYKEIVKYIDKIKSQYEIGEYVNNYKAKTNEKNKPVKDITMTLVVSFLILELIYLYMSKGIEKKAGTIKAFGISDSRVLIVCGLGLSVLVLLSTTIVFILSLVLFDIKLQFLFFLLLEISLITFLILFFEVGIMYKKISPSASMPAK